MVHESGAQLPGPGVGLDLNGVTIDKTCHDGAGVRVVPVPGAGNIFLLPTLFAALEMSNYTSSWRFIFSSEKFSCEIN